MSRQVGRFGRLLNMFTTKQADKDRVSSTHPVSNLRLFKLSAPQNESNAEREYRLKRDELQEWNQHYWATYNRTFFKVCNYFISYSVI